MKYRFTLDIETDTEEHAALVGSALTVVLMAMEENERFAFGFKVGDISLEHADEDIVAWAKSVMEDLGPKVEGSAICMLDMLHDDKSMTAHFWVQVGAMIMKDKPILVLVVGDKELPKKLLAVADEVVRLPEGVNAHGSQQLEEALKRMLEI